MGTTVITSPDIPVFPGPQVRPSEQTQNLVLVGGFSTSVLHSHPRLLCLPSRCCKLACPTFYLGSKLNTTGFLLVRSLVPLILTWGQCRWPLTAQCRVSVLHVIHMNPAFISKHAHKCYFVWALPCSRVATWPGIPALFPKEGSEALSS